MTQEQRKERANIILQKLDELYPQTPPVPLNHSNPWELLVAVILSAQCTDKKVNEVTENLFKKYPTLDDYISANLEEFEQDIKPTGFYKNKAKFVLGAARMIKEKYAGQVPDTMEELLELPGVARKTANVVLGAVYGKQEGIVVDTHIKRLSLKFGLTDAKSPEKIEQDLMGLISRDRWWSFASKLKSYGQDYSPARHKDPSDPISRVLV